MCVWETFPGSPRDLGLNLGKLKPTEWNSLFHFSITCNVFTYHSNIFVENEMLYIIKKIVT